jgi:hypothetical protein
MSLIPPIRKVVPHRSGLLRRPLLQRALPLLALWLGLALGTLPAWSQEPAAKLPIDPDATNVGMYVGDGTSRSKANVIRILESHPGLKVHEITAEDIRSGKLEGCQVVIHPGGSGSRQARALGEEGRARVREFIDSGGGYLGICAGAYLASSHYSWSLDILDARVVDSKHWARGYGDVEIRLSPEARKLLGVEAPKVTIYYHQGPLLAPAEKDDLPAYHAWGIFEGDIAQKGAPEGVMPGTTAIAAGRFGQGKVVCFSPHPERTEGLEPFVIRAVEWLVQPE